MIFNDDDFALIRKLSLVLMGKVFASESTMSAFFYNDNVFFSNIDFF